MRYIWNSGPGSGTAPTSGQFYNGMDDGGTYYIAWLHKTDYDGHDQSAFWMQTLAPLLNSSGQTVRLRVTKETDPNSWIIIEVDGLSPSQGSVTGIGSLTTYMMRGRYWNSYGGSAGTFTDSYLAYGADNSSPGGPGDIVRLTVEHGVALPKAGTTGQALVKASSNDFDVAWTSVVADYTRIGDQQNQSTGTYKSVDWFPRGFGVIGTGAFTSGNAYFCFFTPLYDLTVSNLTFVTGGTATSGLTLARFGLYTVVETVSSATTATSPVCTLVARTASDTTIGNTTNTIYTRAFATTGGYPASYALVGGTRYAAAILMVGTTAGAWQASTISTGTPMRLPPMAAGVMSSQTDLVSITVNNGSFLPWGRIS